MIKNIDKWWHMTYIVYIHIRRKHMDKKKRQLVSCHCLNLRWASYHTIEMYDKYLVPAGITIKQYALLKMTAELSPITVTDLATHMNLERSTLSRNIKVLTDKQYISFTIPRGRGKQLELTSLGIDILSKADIEWNKAQKHFEEKLGTERMKQWNEILTCLLEE